MLEEVVPVVKSLLRLIEIRILNWIWALTYRPFWDLFFYCIILSCFLTIRLSLFLNFLISGVYRYHIFLSVNLNLAYRTTMLFFSLNLNVQAFPAKDMAASCNYRFLRVFIMATSAAYHHRTIYIVVLWIWLSNVTAATTFFCNIIYLHIIKGRLFVLLKIWVILKFWIREILRLICWESNTLIDLIISRRTIHEEDGSNLI